MNDEWWVYHKLNYIKKNHNGQCCVYLHEIYENKLLKTKMSTICNIFL